MTDSGTEPSRTARPSASDALPAGAALFNEGAPLAARGVWDAGEGPPDGDPGRDDRDTTDGDDERLRRGLAATAAATHRAADGDTTGAAECAEVAVEALAGVADWRGVALAPVREWAEGLAAAPETPNLSAAPRVRIDGETPEFGDLSLDAAGVAAPALAGAGEPGDPEALARAAEFACEERGTGRTEFAELLFAYLRTPDARPQVAARLGDHVEREERKRRDVDGLF